MQHPKFYIFSISSSRFHLYLYILSISFLRFHPYFFIWDILTFLYNPCSFQILKIHPEQFHNGILRLAISFLLFHPYDSISSNLSLLFHTIDFHLLYFILTCFIHDFSSQSISSDNTSHSVWNWLEWKIKDETYQDEMLILKVRMKNVGMKCYIYEIVLNW